MHKDICEISDDHNPGAFNVFKHCGKGVGTLCLLLDVLKGFVPVLLASIFLEEQGIAFSFIMIAPVLGHALGVFNHFRGGKCIAVSFGVMLGITPITRIGIIFLALLYVLFSTVLKINPNGKRSIIVYSVFGVCSVVATCCIGLYFVAIGCGAISLIAIIKHLYKRTENFTDKKGETVKYENG